MGSGVVIRDHRGAVVMMVSGTIRGLTDIGSELWTLLIGFLAVDEAQNRDRLVVFHRSVVRAREIWRLDMGLGPLNACFQVIEENVAAAQHDTDEEIEGIGEWLVQDLGLQSMGVQN
ncbi:hypothetical protein POM88_050665 [Heracleum sosnowskyi]|uniref:Uncharacterized protein n=1 Tax=Heracleum sosnowskyi TaxID=360622 RepID=A0AAD8M2N9_9APIA|nr:hypothetical protein POM88_050665 [Heracleum sosnowskyi]